MMLSSFSCASKTILLFFMVLWVDWGSAKWFLHGFLVQLQQIVAETGVMGCFVSPSLLIVDSDAVG